LKFNSLEEGIHPIIHHLVNALFKFVRLHTEKWTVIEKEPSTSIRLGIRIRGSMKDGPCDARYWCKRDSCQKYLDRKRDDSGIYRGLLKRVHINIWDSIPEKKGWIMPMRIPCSSRGR